MASGGEVAMTPEFLSETEGEPASYPALPGTFTVTTAVVWRRLENWIRHRWAERTVTWVVQGPGTWEPRLTPATVDTAERWDGSAWQTVTLTPAPLGYELDDHTYRITATVGSTDDPPDAVLEAGKRLAEYLDQAGADPAKGHSSVTDGDYSFDRPASWAARAMHYSGAADLLRGYR
jgi:hypothetical protein